MTVRVTKEKRGPMEIVDRNRGYRGVDRSLDGVGSLVLGESWWRRYLALSTGFHFLKAEGTGVMVDRD